jgi:hypothetical protein
VFSSTLLFYSLMQSAVKGMKYCIQAKRFVAIIIILFPLLLLAACSGPFTSQQPIINSTADTGGTPIGAVGGGQIGGTPCPGATGIQNADGTHVVYQSLEQQVSKGNALVLSLPGDTSQVVGLFHTQDDLNSYIAQHNAAHSPLYQQHMYSGPSILVLQQVNQDAYDLIILQGKAQGGNPNYDCRVVPSTQVSQVIQQLTSLHTELQGVQPLQLSDYKFTLPTDQNFA